MEGDLLATTRWTGNWPSPDNEPARLMPSLKQLNIRRTQTAVQFLDFRSRVIDCITAFFPFGKGKAIGGLLFKFSDGTRQLVGKAKNDRSISRFACNVITFNPGNEQRIAGVAIYCTDKRLGSPELCGVNSIVVGNNSCPFASLFRLVFLFSCCFSSSILTSNTIFCSAPLTSLMNSSLLNRDGKIWYWDIEGFSLRAATSSRARTNTTTRSVSRSECSSSSNKE